MGFGCMGIPTRGTEGGQGYSRQHESRLAQEIAFYLFVKDFKDRHGSGIFTSERAYMSEKVPDDVNSSLLFEMMSIYFRNWVPPAAFKKNAGTRKEGGMRKPDGMGISPRKSDGSVVTELIEVKPLANTSDGETAMKQMLTKLKDGMKGYLDEARLIKSFDPGIKAETYKFLGSPFIPSGANTAFPLTPLNLQSPSQMDWICYKPTARYRRQLGAFSAIDPDKEGVILYEIHTLDMKRSKDAFDALPENIRGSIRGAFARQVRQNRSANELRLTPWEPDMFARNAAAKQALRDQMMAAGIALAIGVVLLCVFVPPAGAAAAGVVGAELAGTAAAVETTAVVTEEVFLGYRVAPMIRVAGELMRYEEAIEPVTDVAENLARAVIQ